MIQLLVLHGPNLNLFGRREPHIYGSATLAEIDDRLQTLAKELGVGLETFQSNHEGALTSLSRSSRRKPGPRATRADISPSRP